jgi:hypothetical protein
MPPRRLKDGFCLLCSNSKSNAGHQARREAGAQRTLYAVACMPVLGSVLHPKAFFVTVLQHLQRLPFGQELRHNPLIFLTGRIDCQAVP